MDDPVLVAEAVAEAHSLLLRRQCGWGGGGGGGADPPPPSRWGDARTTPSRAIFRSSLHSAAKWARNLRVRDGLDLGRRADPAFDGRPQEGAGPRRRGGAARGGAGGGARPVSGRAALLRGRMGRRQELAASAFRAAATYHRRIDSDQYRSSGLRFMTDAVFFSVQPPYEKVRKESGWTGSNACPVGRRRARDKYLDENEEGNNGPMDDDCTEMGELEGAMRDVYGNDVIDSNSASPSGSAFPLPLEPNGPKTLSARGARHDNALHTWHVARLSNPDHLRPITFRVYIQRPDCFTVHPASGLVGPGKTCYISFGLRAFGSILAEAYESINAGREAVDPLLAAIYSRESHLPFAPFAIRYMYAPPLPCIPFGFRTRSNANGVTITSAVASTLSSTASNHGEKDMISHLWDDAASETNVRTMYVSAHVNANYSIDEFMAMTLMPFEVWKRQSSVPSSPKIEPPLTFISPNVKASDPNLYAQLNNMSVETDESVLGDIFRTEHGCVCCGRDWGARSEELGRAFLLKTLIHDRHARICSFQMQSTLSRLGDTLRQLVAKLPTSSDLTTVSDKEVRQSLREAYDASLQLHAIALSKRAERTVTKVQRQIMLKYEVFLDKFLAFLESHQFPKNGILSLESELLPHYPKSAIGGRNAFSPSVKVGVYRFLRCTDSVFASDNIYFVEGKDEPDNLETFGNLCHNPGWYPLGLQDDPNHINDQRTAHDNILLKKQKNYRCIPWRHADVFKQNPTKAFMSALAMIHNPRSLLVHGVYDRGKSPGDVTHRRSDTSQIFASRLSSLSSASRILVTKIAHRKVQQWSFQQTNKAFFFLSNSDSMLLRHRRTYQRSVDSLLSNSAILGWKQINIDMNDADPQGISTVYQQRVLCLSSYDEYMQNVPSPGLGRFAVSRPISRNNPQFGTANFPVPFIGPFNVQTNIDFSRAEVFSITLPSGTSRTNNAYVPRREQENNDDANEGAAAAPRMINLLWLISAQLGWSVNDDRNPGAVLVERGILIAAQWLSNTLMALPIFLTLVARYTMRIMASPLDYYLDGLPYVQQSQMQYLSSNECGYAAVVVFLLYLILGRFSERHVCRTFERAIMDLVPERTTGNERTRRHSRRISALVLHLQRQWDSIVPLFLQRATFMPRWNRRSREDILNIIIQIRIKDSKEHGKSLPANRACRDNAIDAETLQIHRPLQHTLRTKVIVGLLVSIGSFISCSPYFSLNLLTVFYSSIALGLSMSLQYMEIGDGSIVHDRIFKPMRLNVVVIAAFLMGQLVGSSGGILFLAECVFTSISLFLGGAATISTSAVESWMTFFVLSATSFSGYLFARVGLVENTRNKRIGIASFFLCFSAVALLAMSIFELFFAEWDTPCSVLIIRGTHRFDLRENMHGSGLQ